MRDLLKRGWLVAVPDYEGPGASYCAGLQAAHATLDGIRAVLASASDIGYIQKNASRVAMWGYSGGAFATGFAYEQIASYAPDLLGSVVGAVVGGPAPNLTTVAQAMNKRDTAGLVVASIMGVTAQQPVARQYLVSRLKAEGQYNATAWLAVAKMSGVDALAAYSMQDVYEYFVGGETDVWHPIVQEVIDRDAVMGVDRGKLAAGVPLFVYKAVQDEMSPVKETDDLVAGYCERGATVLYHRNLLGGHNDELWSGRLRTLQFLEHVLDGKKSENLTVPEAGKCVIQDVSVPLDVLELLPDWWWGRR
ncbi:putative lipase 1 precursor [Podospora didyma]|uniref:Lipase 1 n=1 Tax=Podospora didyma TaxID=330526 RepID=A0AAE0NQL7_9PEZI|nr:putative lipase 1 precursor [Podospora didyma]